MTSCVMCGGKGCDLCAWQLRDVPPKKNIVPLGDMVLLRKVPHKESKTPGGIIVPGTIEAQQTEGVVLAVGPDVGRFKGELHHMTHGEAEKSDREGLAFCNLLRARRCPRVNDTVLLGKYSGTLVKLEQQEFLLVREDQILAVVETAR